MSVGRAIEQLAGFQTSPKDAVSVANQELVKSGTTWKKWSVKFKEDSVVMINDVEQFFEKGDIINFEYDYFIYSFKFKEDGKPYYLIAGY
ncbi:hypothetical protein LC76P1_00135 [Lysinibacillus phage LC76P1]|nr:hypothetical protein LC76P1_00135 [Lysinibacillus phage LC76P1]